MLAACKKEMESTPVTVKQLLGLRKATAAVLEFIGTTRAGRWPWEQEKEDETDRRGLDDEQMARG